MRESPRQLVVRTTLLTAAIALGACGTPPTPGPARPNVLFVAVDDLRPELGCYGATHAVTPHIDRLAQSGVRFDRAYCQQAVCNPSRASVMTGLRPETLGVLDLRTDFRATTPDAVTLPQHFAAHGYRTWSVGKIYHNNIPDPASWTERRAFPGEFPFDPDAVYLEPDNLAGLEARKEEIRATGREARHIDRFGRWYLKLCATEAPDCDDDAYFDGAQTTAAIEKLTELASLDEPFFAGVGFYRPHLPFNAPKRYWDLYDPETIPLADPGTLTENAPSAAINNLRELRGYTDFRDAPLPYDGALSEAQQRHLKHGYLASVSYVDAQIGRLLDALDELGLAEDTIVVLWSDHGWKLGEHRSWGKMTNYEVDARVPLIVRAPGHAAGAESRALVELLDVYPTLAELCGLPAPEDLEGESFAALLDDPAAPGPDAAYHVFLREGIWRGPDGITYFGRAVRTDRWRYVEWFDQAAPDTLVATELYDQRDDPGETKNLADEPAYAKTASRLAESLSRHLLTRSR